MGKYMRKAKTAAEVAVMEVSQSSLGVRTRARTLAQRLQTSAAATTGGVSGGGGGGSYLQLRNRRLEKPPVLVNDSSRRQKQGQGKDKEKEKEERNSNGGGGNSRTARTRVGPGESGSRGSGQKKQNSGKNEEVKEVVGGEEEKNSDLGIEASFGENVLDNEARERTTRESTPCSLIRDPEVVRTPGSTTRPTSSIQIRGAQNSNRRQIPTAHEMDQFFADAEEDQRHQFIEKYNYDPVNDKPLPGQFQWEKLDS